MIHDFDFQDYIGQTIDDAQCLYLSLFIDQGDVDSSWIEMIITVMNCLAMSGVHDFQV